MKRILSLLICMAIVLSSVGVVTFADENHWSYNYIKGMLESGVVSGDQNGNLNLDNLITRAEFAKTVNKYFGYTVKAEQGFNDVTADKWYYNDMLIAKGTGYMIGDASGNANADSYITRAETFVIIARLLNLDDDNTVSFSDEAEIPAWAKGKIGALVKKGIISGYNDGTIKANGNITRAEAFTVVSKNERNALPSDAPVSEALGNTSSMTQTNSTPVAGNPSFGGGSGGGGGGGGSSASSTLSAFIDLGEFSAPNYNVQLTLRNFAKVEFLYTVNENNHEYIIDATNSLNRVSGDVFNVNIGSHVQTIVAGENANGKVVTLKSITARGVQGYQDSVYNTNKVLSADILKKYSVTSLKSNGINTNGELEIQWDALPNANEIDDYIVYVYPSNDFISSTPTITYAVNNKNATSYKIPLCSDFETFTFNKDYYVAVAVKKGTLFGSPYSEYSVKEKSGFLGGDGSKDKPYKVGNAAHVKNISLYPTSNFIQVRDIEEPITTMVETTFSGVYDGNNFSLNLDIDVDEVKTTGLFKDVAGAIFRNMIIKGSVVNIAKTVDNNGKVTSGTAGVGAISGSSTGTTKFENCKNYATVTGYSLVGGIVGTINGGEIKNCINYGAVGSAIAGTSSSSSGRVNAYCGGIAGKASSTAISGCGNEGEVRDIGGNAMYFGGITGYLYNTNITYSYNKGNVTGLMRVGGIVGCEEYKNVVFSNAYGIHNSYNAGTVSGSSGHAGGLSGTLLYDAKVTYGSPLYTNNFNTGDVPKGAGLVYFWAHGSNLVAIDGFYDATGKNVYVVYSATYVEPTLTSCYILSDEAVTQGTKIDSEGLKALTTSGDSVFANAEVWKASSVGNYYEYPQLVSNDGISSYYKNFKLDTFSDMTKKYTLSWESKFPAGTTYKVMSGDEVLATTTNRTVDIDLLVDSLDVYVQAEVEGKVYKASAIKLYNYLPYNLKVAYNSENEEYTLSWDGYSADNSVSYSVYVGNNQPVVTTNKSQIIDIILKSNVEVYVVATVDGKTYTSMKISASDYIPRNMEVSYENGNYVLTWDCAASNATYEVYYDGVDTPVVENARKHIIDFGDNQTVDLYIAAVVGEESYNSELCSVSKTLAPYNLAISNSGKVYSLSWDCAIKDSVDYEVYANGVLLGTTKNKTYVVDVDGVENVEFTVSSVITANDKYSSEAYSFVNYAPVIASGDYVDGVCTVVWTAKPEAESFSVYVNGSLAASNITTKSFGIDFGGKPNAKVYVTTEIDGVTYYSDEVTVNNKAPLNLASEYVDGKYRLTWTCILAGPTYKVYVDGTEVGQTEELTYDVSIAEGSAAKIKIVAVDNGEEYIAEKQFTYLELLGIKGAGSETDPYIIKTANQYNAIFGENSSSAIYTADKVYAITADIDLTTIDGGFKVHDKYEKFVGTVYGADENGNKVQRTINFGTLGTESDPYTAASNSSNSLTAAMFPRFGGKLSYITLEGSIYSGAATGTGAVTAYAEGAVIIDNVINNMDITGKVKVGGIVGNADASNGSVITNTTNNGTITAVGSNTYAVAGGIVAHTTRLVDFDNCVNNGDITAPKNAAGILGASGASGSNITKAPEIKNCINNGTIAGGMNTGGIAGSLAPLPSTTNGSLVINCHNTGNVSSGSTYVGGVVGFATAATVKYCSNTGNISSTNNYVGGIVGRFGPGITDAEPIVFEENWNSGNVSGAQRTGGLIATIWKTSTDDRKVIVRNCYNLGNITASINAGGITGYNYKDTKLATQDNGVNEYIGCYSIVNNAAVPYDNAGKTLTSVYVNGTGGVTLDTIKGLISSDPLFQDDTVWTIDTANGFEYPQLVNNPAE